MSSSSEPISSVQPGFWPPPFAARTGIGSLPHTEIGAALAVSFGHEIPFLPQLPMLDPGEQMLAAALDGLPGVGPDGKIDIEVWSGQRDQFRRVVEGALESGDYSSFEPTVHACYRPFLREVVSRKPQFAKVQIAGPATVRRFCRTSTGKPTGEIPELDQQIFLLLLTKSLAVVSAVQRANAVPILFFDEPGLVGLELQHPAHQLGLQRLKLLIRAAQQAGARVGLHCCGNTQWAALLGLGLDLLSIDARLSLDALLEEQAAYSKFLAVGATLCLGVIPTDPGAIYAVTELADSIEVSLSVSTPKNQLGLGRLVLTAACGLGARSVADAERIIDEVAQTQQQLKQSRSSSTPPASPS